MLTLAPRAEPTTEVDRTWLLDMLASLEAGDVEICKEILRAAIRLIDRKVENEN